MIPVAYGGNNTAGPIDVATACNAHGGPHGRLDFESETLIANSVQASAEHHGHSSPRGDGSDNLVAMRESGQGYWMEDDKAGALRAEGENRPSRPSQVIGFQSNSGSQKGDIHVDQSPPVKVGSQGQSGNPPAVAYGLRNDASRDGEAKKPSPDAEGNLRKRDAGFNVQKEQSPTLDATGPHTVAYDTTQVTHPENRSNPQPGDPCHPLAAKGHPPAIAFTERTRADGRNLECLEEQSYALTNPGAGGCSHCRKIMQAMKVRRLTPRECERLQGFPDDHTLVTYRNKPAADGPRYKAIGNSMCVNVMRWIGERIEQVTHILKEVPNA